MTPQDVLRKARGLISDPDKWIGKRRMAEAKDGREVNPREPEAYRFCLLGALIHVTVADADYAVARNVVGRLLGERMVGIWNDTHTHGEVLDLLDRAITSATQQLTTTEKSDG